MRNKGLLISAILLIVVGLVGITASAIPGQRAGLPGGGNAAGNVERMFIEEMVPHHQDAIDMAELGIAKAEHPELKELARQIKRTQSEENDQMRAWYRDWFDRDLDADGSSGMMGGRGGRGGMGGMMGGDVDLDDLEDADSFDKVFIEQMIPHHRMGIMMAQMAGNATRRGDLRDFTANIIEVQSDEIETMSDWYDEWYGR